MLNRFEGIYYDTPCLIEIYINKVIITGINLNKELSKDNFNELVKNNLIEILY